MVGRSRAVLTFGWPPPAAGWRPAATLFHQEEGSPSAESLVERIRSWGRADGRVRIAGADTLIRRRIGGFRQFQELIAAVRPSGADVLVGIDAFAWAYLRGINNLDLCLPAGDDDDDGALRGEDRWSEQEATVREQLRLYERLEDDGSDPELPGDAVSKVEHRRFRGVLLRPSARDELRVLATLLMSGPSKPEEITDDLGLSKHLSESVISPFRGEEGRHVIAMAGSEFRIRRGAIPWVLFALKRRLGLDLLSLLEGA